MTDEGVELLSGQYRWWISATALLSVAVVGWVASLYIGHLQPANPTRPVPWNPAVQTYRDLGALVARRPLLLAALGSSFFWSLGVLAQTNIDKFAIPELVTDQHYVGFLLAIVTLGIGLGAVLAGLWSRGRVEVGLTPVGAAGITLSLLLLTTVPAGHGQPFSAPFLWASLWLLGLGISAGLYDIPLLAFMQERSPPESRGRVLAAYNFLSFTGMFLTSGIFWVLASLLDLSARQIFLVAGLTTFGVLVFIVWLIPLPLARVIFGLLITVFYRLRIHGAEHVPQGRGAILVSNHISWIDGLLLGYCTPRRVVMVADAANLRNPLVRRITSDGGVIGFSPGDRRSVLQTVRHIRRLLQQGRAVHIFAEGGISRTNQVLGFNSGFLTMQKGTDVPVIPMCSHGLWGSLFTFSEGRFFRKWPRMRRLPISIDFGPPLHDPPDVQRVRTAVLQLISRAARRPEHYPLLPPRQLLRTCRRHKRRTRLVDSHGQHWTGGQLLERILLWRRLLHRSLPPDATTVAVALRPSVDAVAVYAALTLDRRITVAVDPDRPDRIPACLAATGTGTLLVDAPTDEHLDPDAAARSLRLDTLLAQATDRDRTIAWWQAQVLPVGLLERWLRLTQTAPEHVLAVLFADDRDQPPRGIQLTHGNIASNVEVCCETLFVTRDDRLLTPEPFSSGLGFTMGLWSALLRDHSAALYAESGGGPDWPSFCRQAGATILFATSEQIETQLAASASLERPQAASDGKLPLRMAFLGGATLSGELADAFEQRFGVRPYGCYVRTELSPIAAVNVPPQPQIEWQTTCREGTVGRTLSGVAARIVDPETGEELGADCEGLLQIQGPNVTRGYWNQPKATEQAFRDGWFVTGDLAKIDTDGFLHLTGRLDQRSPSR
jgi:acyl-[acyl-carrier-protein]-phospholipid O-acyltransferase / long-chain-fatty-acid--[acyl-carrier-protein] ligase